MFEEKVFKYHIKIVIVIFNQYFEIPFRIKLYSLNIYKTFINSRKSILFGKSNAKYPRPLNCTYYKSGLLCMTGIISQTILKLAKAPYTLLVVEDH